MNHLKLLGGAGVIGILFFSLFITGAALGGDTAVNESRTMQDVEQELTREETNFQKNLTQTQQNATTPGAVVLTLVKAQATQAWSVVWLGIDFGYNNPQAAHVLGQVGPVVLMIMIARMIIQSLESILAWRRE